MKPVITTTCELLLQQFNEIHLSSAENQLNTVYHKKIQITSQCFYYYFRVTMFIVGPIGFLGVVQNVNGQRKERMYYKRVLQQEERQKELEGQR